MVFTKEQFLAVLDDIRARVVNGDSTEGMISYCSDYTAMHDKIQPGEFDVQARYIMKNSVTEPKMRFISNETDGVFNQNRI